MIENLVLYGMHTHVHTDTHVQEHTWIDPQMPELPHYQTNQRLIEEHSRFWAHQHVLQTHTTHSAAFYVQDNPLLPYQATITQTSPPKHLDTSLSYILHLQEPQVEIPTIQLSLLDLTVVVYVCFMY